MPKTTSPPFEFGGAHFLDGFATHLGEKPGPTLDKLAADTDQYVLLHMYLIPGDTRDDRRTQIRSRIWAELAELHAVPLHTDAFAVPYFRSTPAQIALQVWLRLVAAGAKPSTEDEHDWQTGDVIYVHYVDDCGMHATATKPLSRTALQMPVG